MRSFALYGGDGAFGCRLDGQVAMFLQECDVHFVFGKRAHGAFHASCGAVARLFRVRGVAGGVVHWLGRGNCANTGRVGTHRGFQSVAAGASSLPFN